MAKSSSKKKTRSKALAGPTNNDEQISVEKISNGFLIVTSKVVRGQYKSTKVFSKTRPRVVMGKA